MQQITRNCRNNTYVELALNNTSGFGGKLLKPAAMPKYLVRFINDITPTLFNLSTVTIYSSCCKFISVIDFINTQYKKYSLCQYKFIGHLYTLNTRKHANTLLL